MTVVDYILLEAPQFAIVENSITLSGELVVDNTITITLNGVSTSILFDTDSQTTLDKLVLNLSAIYFVESVVSDGLKLTIIISRELLQDIVITGSISGGVTQAIVNISPLRLASRNGFINLATLNINRSWYNANYEYALALFVCHCLELQALALLGGVGSVAGAVVGLKQGDLATSYASNGSAVLSTETDLGRTSYGLKLISLRRRSNMTIGSTGYKGFFL